MGILFEIELTSDAGEIHGLAMGHVTIVTDDKCVSSKEANQPMMIFVTLSELLDGMTALTSKGGGRFTLVGTDSSFALSFDCERGWLTLRHQRAIVVKAPWKDVRAAVWDEVQRFLDGHGDRFLRADPTSAAVFDDLIRSKAAFAKALDVERRAP